MTVSVLSDANGTEQCRINHLIELALTAFNSGVMMISSVNIQKIKAAVRTFNLPELKLLSPRPGPGQLIL
jgi:hypothetical protein